MTDYRDEDIPKLFKIVLVHPEREEEIKQAMIPLIPNLQEARSKFGRHSRQFDDMWRLWMMMLGYRIYKEEHANEQPEQYEAGILNVGREMRGLVQRGMMFGTLDGNARTDAIRRFEKGQRVTDIKPDLIKIYQDMLEILVKEDNPAYRSLKPQWDAMWAGLSGGDI